MQGPKPDRERAVASTVDDFHSSFLYSRYYRLDIPKDLIRHLKTDLRTDTIVTLNGPNRTPFDLNSSILNRFITFLLWQHGRLKYRSGRISVRPDNSGPPWRVEFQDLWRPSEFREYDELVVRHGFVKAIDRLFSADLVKELSATAPELRDPTRFPQFDRLFLADPALRYWKKQARLDHALANAHRASATRFAPSEASAFAVELGPEGPSYVVTLRETAPQLPDTAKPVYFSGVEVKYRTAKLPTPGTLPKTRPLVCGLPIADVGREGQPFAGERPVLGSGTLGGFVLRRSDKQVALLTTTGVVGDRREGISDHRIAQPGNSYRVAKDETIADVVDVAWPIPSSSGATAAADNARKNLVDAVLAVLVDQKHGWAQRFPSAFGVPKDPGGPGDACIGDEVFKVGASTQLTFGQVSAVQSCFKISTLTGVYWYDGFFQVTSKDKRNPFSAPGDRGAFVVRSSDGAVLGMVLASSPEVTACAPIRPTLERFNCALI